MIAFLREMSRLTLEKAVFCQHIVCKDVRLIKSDFTFKTK